MASACVPLGEFCFHKLEMSPKRLLRSLLRRSYLLFFWVNLPRAVVVSLNSFPAVFWGRRRKATTRFIQRKLNYAVSLYLDSPSLHEESLHDSTNENYLLDVCKSRPCLCSGSGRWGGTRARTACQSLSSLLRRTLCFRVAMRVLDNCAGLFDLRRYRTSRRCTLLICLIQATTAATFTETWSDRCAQVTAGRIRGMTIFWQLGKGALAIILLLRSKRFGCKVQKLIQVDVSNQQICKRGLPWLRGAFVSRKARAIAPFRQVCHLPPRWG